jgi:hypothetical protein
MSFLIADREEGPLGLHRRQNAITILESVTAHVEKILDG